MALAAKPSLTVHGPGLQEPEAVKAALKGMKFDAVYDLNGACLFAVRTRLPARLLVALVS